MNNAKKVPFAQENGMKCICGKCPVQIKSQCSKIKMNKLMQAMNTSSSSSALPLARQAMKDDQGAKAMPKPEEVPVLYCSGGAAACDDLDMKQMCICGSCPIWEEYKLAGGTPFMYYCRDGEAK